MSNLGYFERDPDPPRWLKPAIWLSIPAMALAFGMALVSVFEVAGSRPVPPDARPGLILSAGRDAAPWPAPRVERPQEMLSAAPWQPTDAGELSPAALARLRAEAAAEEARRQALSEIEPDGAEPEAPDPPPEPAPASPGFKAGPVPAAPEAEPVPPAAEAEPVPAAAEDGPVPPAAEDGPVPPAPATVAVTVAPSPPLVVAVPVPAAASPPPLPSVLQPLAPRVAVPVRPAERAGAPRADRRCAALIARFQLGEQPSDAERHRLLSICAPRG